eukprot:gene2087-18142_t
MAQRLGMACRPSVSTRSSVKRVGAVRVQAVANATRTQNAWSPTSWRSKPILQQPTYDDPEELQEALDQIAKMPPLIFAGECRSLQDRLAKCATGEAFYLTGGDCAESFDSFSANRIRDYYRVMLQMSVILAFGGGVPVVKMGRIAGQFAKPRSSDFETKGDLTLPAYRGDNVNGPEFTPEARKNSPARLMKAYNQCASTLNLLRGFSTGGYGGLNRVSQWNMDFMQNSNEGKHYMDIAKRVEEAIGFMVACGMDPKSPLMSETEFYTGHECLLLNYEEALTREDSTSNNYYACSAHFLWCGERTRQLDHAHIEFLRGVKNPIGVKVSDKMPPDDLVSMINNLNPDNTPGRLSVIVRMGANNVRQKLPAMLEAVKAAGQIVTWVSDPMHGNIETVSGYKTRRYDKIRAEIEAFFDVHDACGTIPGGVHLEMTGDDVTECIGGGSSVGEQDLESRYHTHCDPRLNGEQALEIAFYVASRLRTTLYALHSKGFLSQHVQMIGYARSQMNDEELRGRLRAFLPQEEAEKAKVAVFLSQCFYVKGDYDGDDGYAALNKRMLSWEAACGNTKPFGHDLDSSEDLADFIGKLFTEEHLYRIDHYLGKELVQNMLVLRFSNSIMQSWWNRDWISNIQISFKEPFGTQGRGGYFDQYGIVRDVIQNHLVQVMTLMCMESPVSMHPDDIRDEKVKVLRQISVVKPEDCIIGQYTAANGNPGYLDDETVPAGSKQATYAAVKLEIKNERWAGVPIMIKAGKALNERLAAIRIQLKPPPASIFGPLEHMRNELVIKFQPGEAIYAKLVIKK